ncbi:MAG TPA: hypothetical protein VIR26_00255 [Metalysinibacillus sp.]
MRVTRRDNYSSYRAPSRLSNDLVYRDFLHQERHAFQDEPRKKKQQPSAKKSKQLIIRPKGGIIQPMQKEVDIKLASKQNRRASIAKYKNSI